MIDLGFGLWPAAISHLFIAAFVLSVLFGMVARNTEFCPLGGVADIMHKRRPGRFVMYLFAIAVTMAAVTALGTFGLVDFDSTRPPYRMAQFRWPGFILGGMLFGVGMTMCRGCGMKNMLNLGSGDLKAVFAILGMALVAFLLIYFNETVSALFLQTWMQPMVVDLTAHGFNHQDIGTFAAGMIGGEVETWRTGLGLALAALIAAIAFSFRDFRVRRANIWGGLMIGFFVAGLFYITGGPLGAEAQDAADFMDQPQNGLGIQSYTFIRPMGDLANVMLNPLSYLVTIGLVAFLGVGIGSLIVSVFTGSFQLKWFQSPGESLRFFAGGTLVGIGGILGMGCTLGQGLAGTATLALGSFIDLTALIIGAFIGIRLQKNFMDDHVIPEPDRQSKAKP